MATNDFKPWAIAPSANVTDQADYAALPALLSGFSSGVASSAQVNKALRQATVVASVIAQYIANQLNINIADDGNVDALLANLQAAIISSNLVDSVNGKTGAVVLGASDVGAYSTAQSDGKYFPLAGGNVGASGVNSTGNITASGANIIAELGAAGGNYYIQNSSGVNIAQISATAAGVLTIQSLVNGGSITLADNVNTSGTLTTTGALTSDSTIHANSSISSGGNISATGTISSSGAMSSGGILSEAGQRVYSPNNPPPAGAPTSTVGIGQSGWFRDGSTGLITQWGYLGTSNGTYNFPVTFPNACLNFMASNTNSNGVAVDNAFGYPVNNAGFFAATKSATINNDVTNYSVYWTAIGY